MDRSKAVIIKSFGGYDVISVEDHPLPPLDGNVEVDVHYCGLNFADLYTRQGLLPNRTLPLVLGIECAGIVTRVCPSVSEFQVGDRVVCYDYNGGLFRETVCISPTKCFPLPNDVTLEQGAALFVNYLTAHFAIHRLGNLQPKETVLIPSCGGGVGWAMTQLAKRIPEVTVVGAASQSKEEAVRENGVDVVIESKDFDDRLKRSGKRFDLIVDNEGGNKFLLFQETFLKPLGRIVLIGANSLIRDERKLSAFALFKYWWNGRNVTPTSLICNNHSVAGLHLGVLAETERDRVEEALDRIFEMLRQGKIRPRIDSVWPLHEIVQATKTLGERRNIGKVLLSVHAT